VYAVAAAAPSSDSATEEGAAAAAAVAAPVLVSPALVRLRCTVVGGGVEVRATLAMSGSGAPASVHAADVTPAAAAEGSAAAGAWGSAGGIANFYADALRAICSGLLVLPPALIGTGLRSAAAAMQGAQRVCDAVAALRGSGMPVRLSDIGGSWRVAVDVASLGAGVKYRATLALARTWEAFTSPDALASLQGAGIQPREDLRWTAAITRISPVVVTDPAVARSLDSAATLWARTSQLQAAGAKDAAAAVSAIVAAFLPAAVKALGK
jgi:hypothetical protein